MSAQKQNPVPVRLAITTGEPAGVGPELMYHLTTQEPWELPITARTASASTHNPQEPHLRCAFTCSFYRRSHDQ